MILHDLALCNINLREYALAEENCREAIKICKSKAIYKLLAACLIRQSKTGEAIEVFRLSLRSTEIAPTMLAYANLTLMSQQTVS